MSVLVFPDTILMNAYNGNFEHYFNAVYAIFENDFIKTQPVFKGHKVGVRRYPEMDGLHRTFYHITSEGEDEGNRTPDFNRMERIRFPKFVIQNEHHAEILVWKNKRGRDERIVLFNEEEKYVMIITERNGYFMFITAYCVNEGHRKRKLLKEYNEYQKAIQTP